MKPINVLIPMAGEGRRFKELGYTCSKPFIDVHGKPMIERVIDNLLPIGNGHQEMKFIFLARAEDSDDLSKLCRKKSMPRTSTSIVQVEKTTEGAACTALLAKKKIYNDEELLIANCDQIIDYSPENFWTMRMFTTVKEAGIIFVFHDSHSRWSFVKLADTGEVIEVAEKKVISNIATCGIYYFRRGEMFCTAAENMIAADDRTNNEFYLAPTYNHLRKLPANPPPVTIPFYVERMHGLGTPEDLNTYLISTQE
jgi:dTDP-glucose pyrophosphorylase